MTNKGESPEDLHSTGQFVFLDSTAFMQGGTKLNFIKVGTDESLLRHCQVKHPAARWSKAAGKGSNHLSTAQAKGCVCGITLCSSVTTKDDEVVKRNQLRQTDAVR